MVYQQKQKLLDEKSKKMNSKIFRNYFRYRIGNQLNQSLSQIHLQQEEINSCYYHLNQSKYDYRKNSFSFFNFLF